MATSSFQTPINIDPSQNNSDQTSFINQNFQALASTLETNSFRIVLSGKTSITPSPGGTVFVTVPHNLGFVPIPFCYLNGVGRTVGSNQIFTNGNVPLPTWLSIAIDSTNHVINFTGWFDCACDATNLYIFGFDSLASGSGTFGVAYYLVQQPS